MKKITFILIILISLIFSFSVVKGNSSDKTLAIRQSALGTSEFYVVSTGQAFYPRGMNYQEFDSNIKVINFNVGIYDEPTSELVLEKMKNYGYNTVRVALSVNSSLNEERDAISSQYVENFKNFVLLAKSKNIYVEVVIGILPFNSSYYPATIDPNFEGFGFNQFILDTNFVIKKQEYIADFFTELQNINFPFDNVLGWEIENEIYFDLSKKPFTLTSVILASDGNNYSMVNQKSLMVDNVLIFYMNTIRNTIKSISPNSLVTMTLSSPFQNNLAGRYISTQKLINLSEMDYISINMYPKSSSATIDQDYNSFSIAINKPIIISEFGAYPSVFPQIATAIDELKKFQVKMCNQYGIKGWMYYDWDAHEIDSYLRIYHAVEQGELIAHHFSPNYRKDVCQYSPATIIGKIENVTPSGEVFGWIVDPEAIYTTNINFWENGILRGSVTVRFDRTDIRAMYNWYPFSNSFYWKIPSSLMSDSVNHTLQAWAADRNVNGSFSSYQLINSSIVVPKFNP